MDKDQQIEQLIAQVQALQIRVTQLETARNDQGLIVGNRTAASNEFRKGDRVRIRNALKKPATWPRDAVWKKELAQVATVTHLYREQVHFVTDNGVKTWRATNNLETLTDSK
jgi:hypothetical protein